MIVKGRTRSGGTQLAGYLSSSKNDTVKVLDIRGTISTSLTPIGLRDALNEMDAIGGMAKGEKHIFHAVINPNDLDRLGRDDWQAAITKVEKALGFEAQPRVIVAHNYKGKEHLHIAWSRVDVDNGKLISDSFCNLKMVQAAREIELERGLFKTPDRNKNQRAAALNRILDENRHTVDPIEAARPFMKAEERQRNAEKERLKLERSDNSRDVLKRTIASAWHQSENGEEFRRKLERAALRLVRGDRGAVVMDEGGNIYSPARYIEGAKVKEINRKCADVLQQLPTADQARHHGRKTILSPRKAAELVKGKLTFELSNDPERARGQRPEPR